MSSKRDLALADPDLHQRQKKVLSSLSNHWAGLTVFVEHLQTPMDNNKGENSLRNPATGRKNYYGSGAVWSANLAAMLFSVILFTPSSLGDSCLAQPAITTGRQARGFSLVE